MTANATSNSASSRESTIDSKGDDHPAAAEPRFGDLPEEAKQAVIEELSILAEVRKNLEYLRSRLLNRVNREENRARELTSELVNAKRDEEKQMVASAEAVSHALRDKGIVDIKSLDDLLSRPYFGRIIVEENDDRGGKKTFECRIGNHSAMDCRIIDWRRAPLAKLYYEYKEGDEFSEEILGRERVGTIKKRRTIEIKNGVLQRFTYGEGEIALKNGVWTLSSSGRGASKVTGEMSDVLAFISADQFKTITSAAREPVMVQGIAGSGKTVIAVHRLAWLAAGHLAPEKTLFLARGEALTNYVRRSLASRDLSSVHAHEISTWGHKQFTVAFPTLSVAHTHDTLTTSTTTKRVKRSLSLIAALEAAPAPTDTSKALELYLSVLSRGRELAEREQSKLTGAADFERAWSETKNLATQNFVDEVDLWHLVRLAQRVWKVTGAPTGAHLKLDHVVIDEVQDLSAAQIVCAIGASRAPGDITLVGDAGQRTAVGGFPGWEALRKILRIEGNTSFVTLDVSHRSSLPIMRLAEHIQGRSLVRDGKPGRVPLLLRARTEPEALTAAIDWTKKALELYPMSPCAVLTRDRAAARELLSLVRPTLGHAARRIDEDPSLNAGVVIGAIEDVKGLEFTNVSIWDASKKTYGSSEDERNLLYVAVTRSEENLSLICAGQPADLLPHERTKLLRVHRIEPEDEETNEAAGEFDDIAKAARELDS